MDYIFQDLPVHILIVHLVIVAVPLVSVLLVLVAAWPAARRILWIPVVAASLLLVPLAMVTVEAGKWLEARVPDAPLIQEHATLGETLVPWMYGLAVVGIAIGAWAVVELRARRRAAEATTDASQRRPNRGVVGLASAVLAVAAVLVGAGATWTVVQIGESGSRAVWEGSFSDEPVD